MVSEAKRRFGLYVTGEDKSAIHPSLRNAVFQIAVRQGGNAEYQALKDEWKNTTSVDGKEITLCAMGRLQTPELLSDYLNFMFTDVPIQDIHTSAMILATSSKARLGLWKYIKEHFDQIKTQIGGSSVILDRFLRVSLDKFADRETERDIEDFFADRDNRGYDRTLKNVSDAINGRAGYKERDAKVILEWLKVYGFA